jgi:hypothetical protein
MRHLSSAAGIQEALTKAAVGEQDKTYELQTIVVFDRGESLYRLGMVQDLAQMGCMAWPKVP